LAVVTVTGCADISAPDHAWLERRSDTVQVACNHTSERWHLVCKGVDWVGAFGNCTPGPATGIDSSRVHIGKFHSPQTGSVSHQLNTSQWSLQQF